LGAPVNETGKYWGLQSLSGASSYFAWYRICGGALVRRINFENTRFGAIA